MFQKKEIILIFVVNINLCSERKYDNIVTINHHILEILSALEEFFHNFVLKRHIGG